MSPRAEQKQQTRHALMDAARSLMDSGRGFGSLSLREVSRTAGIVPTGFYRHFQDMDELGLALVAEALLHTIGLAFLYGLFHGVLPPTSAALRWRLFGLPAVVAMGQQLPFADASFDAAQCLGVLDTTSDKTGALAELRRVLTDGGRLGLLVFVADGPLTSPPPDGNEFPSEAETRELLAAAGFEVADAADADLSEFARGRIVDPDT